MASTVPTRKSRNDPATARRTRPAVMLSSAPASTCASRNRADSAGPANPRAAKQSTGSDVSTPAIPLERPRPCSISSSTGPTLLTAVRRLSPVSTIATAMSTSPRPPASRGGADDGGAEELTGGFSACARNAREPGSATASADPRSARHGAWDLPPHRLLHQQGEDGGDQDPDQVDPQLGGRLGDLVAVAERQAQGDGAGRRHGGDRDE